MRQPFCPYLAEMPVLGKPELIFDNDGVAVIVTREDVDAAVADRKFSILKFQRTEA